MTTYFTLDNNLKTELVNDFIQILNGNQSTVYWFSGSLTKGNSYNGYLATVNGDSVDVVLKLLYPDNVFDSFYSGTATKRGIIKDSTYIETKTVVYPKFERNQIW